MKGSGTMKLNNMLAIGVAAAALFMTGCTVDKTKEGNVPDVDVDVKGETELPHYDVKPADIDVGSTKTEVTVPTVDVNMPPKDNQTPAPANSDQ
jgi:hypothetical protein